MRGNAVLSSFYMLGGGFAEKMGSSLYLEAEPL